MKNAGSVIMLTSSLLLTGNVMAEEKAKSEWQSEFELGYIKTTGNTETQSSVAKADATYEAGKWRHNVNAEAYGSESSDKVTGENVVSAERYQLSGKSDYNFTEHDYAFGLVKLKKDRFSGFEYEHVISAGYGRKVIKEAAMELDLEIGPGVRFYKEDDAPESEEEALLRLAGKYWWKITGNSKFSQSLVFDIGEEVTSTESITGLQANINKTLAMKFTFTLRHKSDVPVATPAIEKTDTETAITLVYSY